MSKQDFTLVRKNIRRMYLRIKNAKLIVSAPLNMPLAQIQDFIQEKQPWISKHLAKSVSEKTLLYFGVACGLEVIPSDLDIVRLRHKKFEVFTNKDPQSLLEFWYKKRAKAYLVKTVRKYLKITNLSIEILRIKPMQSRWGSCNHDKKYINLNENLIRQDKRFIDYVVLHEIAHLVHPNHSKDFHLFVQNYMPNQKEARSLLR